MGDEKEYTKDMEEWLQFMVKSGLIEQMKKQIEALEKHDIFRIWKSARKGGKTTLSAILNLNQGLSELKQDFILHGKTSIIEFQRLKEVLRDYIKANKELAKQLNVDVSVDHDKFLKKLSEGNK